jgi:hypothetical protein
LAEGFPQGVRDERQQEAGAQGKELRLLVQDGAGEPRAHPARYCERLRLVDGSIREQLGEGRFAAAESERLVELSSILRVPAKEIVSVIFDAKRAELEAEEAEALRAIKSHVRRAG